MLVNTAVMQSGIELERFIDHSKEHKNIYMKITIELTDKEMKEGKLTEVQNLFNRGMNEVAVEVRPGGIFKEQDVVMMLKEHNAKVNGEQEYLRVPEEMMKDLPRGT